MSKASDLVYGRRGGRFTTQTPGAAEEAIALMGELRKERDAAAPAPSDQLELFGGES